MNKLNCRLRLLSAGAALSILMMASPAAFAETPKDTLVEGFAIDGKGFYHFDTTWKSE